MNRNVKMWALLVEFCACNNVEEPGLERACQGESDLEGVFELKAKAQRIAREGFWLDDKTFIPPASLVQLKIVPMQEAAHGR